MVRLSLCQVKIPLGSDFVQNAARDGRILWTEPVAEMEIHNSIARAISGVVSIDNDASFVLDGSGEMIAITDTGLDRDHPDIDGRVAQFTHNLALILHRLILTVVMGLM